MSKKDFIEKLENELNQRNINQESVEEIIDDYNEIIDGALEKGEDEISVLERIGRPFDIARTLSKVEKKQPKQKQNDGETKPKRKKEGKFVALSPFIATIAFFVIGFQYGLWHPGWLVFLLIPIAGILEGMRDDFGDALTGLTVFGATIGFFLLGYFYSLWHPAWMLFLLIPIVGILSDSKDDILDKLVGLTTFAVIIFYVVMGTYYDLWHPAWVVFFLIPLMTVFDRKKTSDRLLSVLVFLIIPVFYLYLEYINFSDYNYLIFVVSILIGINQGYIHIGIKVEDLRTKEGLTVVAIIVAYIVMGIFFDLWHPGWLVFLLIPVMMMLYEEKRPPFVAFSPFIATAAFILLGYYYDIWHLAWMAFLLIPISGILSE